MHKESGKLPVQEKMRVKKLKKDVLAIKWVSSSKRSCKCDFQKVVYLRSKKPNFVKRDHSYFLDKKCYSFENSR